MLFSSQRSRRVGRSGYLVLLVFVRFLSVQEPTGRSGQQVILLYFCRALFAFSAFVSFAIREPPIAEVDCDESSQPRNRLSSLWNDHLVIRECVDWWGLRLVSMSGQTLKTLFF